MLILLAIIALVATSAAFFGGVFSDKQLKSAQEYYFAERGIYYGIYYIKKYPAASFPLNYYYPSFNDNERAHVEVTRSDTPANYSYIIKSTSYGGRQITAEYKDGIIQSFTSSG